MIRSVMVLKSGIDLKQYKQYKLLYTFLKRQNENYKPKKLKVLERKELTQFFLQAPDEEFLMIKVSR
jgi:type I restriction-modification system DNA methylase subunit